eukprot:4642672-Alexandrium_andersonii.AAC.1
MHSEAQLRSAAQLRSQSVHSEPDLHTGARLAQEAETCTQKLGSGSSASALRSPSALRSSAQRGGLKCTLVATLASAE